MDDLVGLFTSTAWDIRWHPKTTKKEGEMKVWVGCARGVQAAYVTLRHRGCTLVPSSTWAKQVPRVLGVPTVALAVRATLERG